MQTVARLEIDRLIMLIDKAEWHLERGQNECAKQTYQEAMQLRIRIANRLAIENYLQQKYNRMQ